MDDFPSYAHKFNQRTFHVRLINLCTSDKKSSHKIRHKETPRVHYDIGEDNGRYAIYETNNLGDFVFESYTGNNRNSFNDDSIEETHSTGNSYYETSGVCGDNITWQVINGELILSGTGWTWDYDYEDSVIPPWFNVRSSIERVKIGEGITDIGDDVFYALSSLKSVSIPRSLNTIDYGAFASCYRITDVYYSGSEEEWESLCTQIALVGNNWIVDANIHYNGTGPGD